MRSAEPANKERGCRHCRDRASPANCQADECAAAHLRAAGAAGAAGRGGRRRQLATRGPLAGAGQRGPARKSLHRPLRTAKYLQHHGESALVCCRIVRRKLNGFRAAVDMQQIRIVTLYSLERFHFIVLASLGREMAKDTRSSGLNEPRRGRTIKKPGGERAGECQRDRVFVQRYLRPSGPIRCGRTYCASNQRCLPLPWLQRRMRTLRTHDPPHHGRGGQCGRRIVFVLRSPLTRIPIPICLKRSKGSRPLHKSPPAAPAPGIAIVSNSD